MRQTTHSFQFHAFIMKRPIQFAIPTLTALVLSHCGHIHTTREEFAVERDATVHGAALTAELIPTEGRVNYSLSAMVYVMAGEVESGPYRCLLTAWGEPGLHRSMTVDRLVIRTASGKSEVFPASGRLRFEPGDREDRTQATYLVPGLLEIDYKKDGDVTLEAIVRIEGKRRTEKRAITLLLHPAPVKERAFASVFDDLRKSDRSPSDGDEGAVYH